MYHPFLQFLFSFCYCCCLYSTCEFLYTAVDLHIFYFFARYGGCAAVLSHFRDGPIGPFLVQFAFYVFIVRSNISAGFVWLVHQYFKSSSIRERELSFPKTFPVLGLTKPRTLGGERPTPADLHQVIKLAHAERLPLGTFAGFGPL